jgi:opacity protein-like surface antigen
MSARWIMGVACLAAGLAQAGYADVIDITPFYGYRFGGEFTDADTGAQYDIRDSPAWGGMLDIPLSKSSQVEFYYSRQETELQLEDDLFGSTKLFDLDVDYYHLGGTLVLPEGPWQPFVVTTFGVTYLAPDAPGTDSLTDFSLGFGGGVRFVPTEHFSLYFAGRGLITFMEGNVVYRSESGATTVKIHSDGFWQFELQAGLTFAF